MAFKDARWTLANVLPVMFVGMIITAIWSLYIWVHLVPMIQAPAAYGGAVLAAERDAGSIMRGMVEAVIHTTLTFMMLLCFWKAVFTDPGSVPKTTEWLIPNESEREDARGVNNNAAGSNALCNEVKHSGKRRFCKWCNQFKPDRAHHCRVCRSCILKMDHHCPWVANCIGFWNHKFFFLLVLYSLINCLFVVVTMSETLYRVLYLDETSNTHRFCVVFGVTLASMMGFLLMMFFSFHTWLMLRATTTIEFCEKAYRSVPAKGEASKPSMYNSGWVMNVKAVLGPNVFLWLLPCSPAEGDGLSFTASGGLTEKLATAFASSSATADTFSRENSDEPPKGAERVNGNSVKVNGVARNLSISSPASFAKSIAAANREEDDSVHETDNDDAEPEVTRAGTVHF